MELFKQFEKRCKNEIGMYHLITQIPSHLEKARGGKSFRKKTDCDFAAGIDGRAVFFDAKVCGDHRFNLKSLILRPEKIHQYEFLLKAVEKGSIGGYLIWFYNHSKIAWLPVEVIGKMEDKSVSTLSEEVKTQNDDKPIELQRLIWGL